ncbi:exoribonuclease R, partial [Rhodococcus opacus M213]
PPIRSATPPEWNFCTGGPTHAPRFTATVHLAGHTATADATTKTAAKTVPATALIETLSDSAKNDGCLR